MENPFYNPREHRLRAGWRLVIQFLLMLALLFGMQYLLTYLIDSSTFLINRLPAVIAFTGSCWVAARYLDNRPFLSFGLSVDRRWFREFGAGMLIGGAVMAVIFLLQLALGWIALEPVNWAGTAGDNGGFGGILVSILGFFAGMVLVGFYEELVFRGYQITNLIEGFRSPEGGEARPVIMAVGISSVFFGILHAGNPNADLVSTLNIMLAGGVLAAPYIVTGSLALPVGLHASWNFFQGGIFGFPVSGKTPPASLLQINETGPDLFTGGAFGPEAGLTGILGLLLILLMVYLYIKRAGYPAELHHNFK
ncbi:MAG: type II CAAX endopeptidase family protein [Balneolaceae bacterium]|nr:type II CAAX endopeptidase family protein [Balneolaceae bacterium]